MAAASKAIKVGDLVRLKTDTYSQYGAYKGESYRVTYVNGSNVNIDIPGHAPISVNKTMLELGPQTKSELIAKLKNLEAEVKSLKAKLKWMDETNSETYDDHEFKVWNVLGTLDSRVSRIEKARAISEMIKQ